MDELARVEQKDPTGRALLLLWDGPRSELPGHCRGRRDPEQGRALEEADRGRGAGRPGRPDRRAAEAIVEAWQAVNKLGGHPDAEPHRAPSRDRPRIALKALESLAALPHGEDEASDRALLKAWGDRFRVSGRLHRGRPIPGARPRGQGARRPAPRTEENGSIEADHGQGTEQRVLDAAEALPPGYGASFAERIGKARERLAASTALDQALSAPQPSDLAIADAAERARAGGTWPADPGLPARCELAIRRRDLFALARGDLDGITLGRAGRPVGRSVGQRRSWPTAATPASIATRHAAAVARNAAFAELERGLSGGDAIKVKRLARDADPRRSPRIVRAAKPRSTRLIAKSEQVERLLAAARSGHAEAFLAEADPRSSPPIRVSSPLFATRSLPGSMPGSARRHFACRPTRCFFPTPAEQR